MLGEVVSAHLRSLQAQHLTDVLSTDQHTVKPWFNGRLDVAPPVVDLTAQGFTLLGGRLDYVDAKPVAAIVYRRRVHIINLFCAPAPGSGDRAAAMESLHGFNVRRWSENGLNLWAVSDINADELARIRREIRGGAEAVIMARVKCVVPSRSMRASRSISHDRYSFMAAFGVARPLVGLEPDVERLVRHLGVGRERKSGGGPGGVAALEPAHRQCR